MPSSCSRSKTSIHSTFSAKPYCRASTRRRKNQDATAQTDTDIPPKRISKTVISHLLPYGLSLSETLKMRKRTREQEEKAWRGRKSKEETEVRINHIESIVDASRAPEESDTYTSLQRLELLNMEEEVRILARRSVVEAWEKIAEEHWGVTVDARTGVPSGSETVCPAVSDPQCLSNIFVYSSIHMGSCRARRTRN